MNINKNNYEVYFIDYYDGNLSAEQSAALFLFLESHPELKEEFHSFSNMPLDIPELHFPNRDSLKKTEVIIVSMDEQLVASMEGDLSVDEKQKLESHLQSNPKLKKEAELFKATISVPDLSVVYPDKKSLKKPVPFYIAYRNEIRFSIAAILLLGFIAGTVSIFNRTMEKNATQVAEETPGKVPAALQPDISDASDNSYPAPQKNKMTIEKTGITTNQRIAEKNKRATVTDHRINQLNQPDKVAPGIQEAQVQLAEAIPTVQLPVTKEIIPEAAQPAANINQAVTGNSSEKYLTVWEALRQSSEKNLKKIVADEESVFAYADDAAEVKPTLVDVVSKGLEKISNDKVKLDTDKQSKNYSFSAGNFKIERK